MLDDFYFYMSVGGYPPEQPFSGGEDVAFSSILEKDTEKSK